LRLFGLIEVIIAETSPVWSVTPWLDSAREASPRLRLSRRPFANPDRRIRIELELPDWEQRLRLGLEAPRPASHLQLGGEFLQPIGGFETLIVWKRGGGPYLVIEQVCLHERNATVVFLNWASAQPPQLVRRDLEELGDLHYFIGHVLVLLPAC
jgi:hypothetical protein